MNNGEQQQLAVMGIGSRAAIAAATRVLLPDFRPLAVVKELQSGGMKVKAVL